MEPRNDENPTPTNVHSNVVVTQKGTKSDSSMSSMLLQNLIDNMELLQLGTYQREHVSNVSMAPSNLARKLFDTGLRLMMSYQHEMAALYFHACIKVGPPVALAHGLIALCHGPNYNFKGDLYYSTSNHDDDVQKPDLECLFPSQQVADRHSAAAMAIIDKLQQRRYQHEGHCDVVKQVGDTKTTAIQPFKGSTDSCNNKENVETTGDISDVEVQFLSAIRVLTGSAGVDPSLSDEVVGRPYANAMRSVYQKYPDDPDIAYFFVESLMVLNAWQLYEYPSGTALSPDVDEIRKVLERALEMHKHHPGLLHLYVHLSEMSPQPELALSICEPLRTMFPHAGHLMHMQTHIDVLVGQYDTCVRSNLDAIQADMFTMQISPSTAGRESLYFGYIVHNFHMAIYGSILGGMEQIGMQIATELNALVNENLFNEHPHLVAYLETYSASEIHVMVRYGRWAALLEVEMPVDENLMLYRTASVLYGRALAHAMSGNIIEATKEADQYDALRKKYPEASQRILHNNSVADLLAVDAVMIRGEIAYRAGQHTEGIALLQKAVDMQDSLNFDEPWGKMQPIRHALGGLLLEQGHVGEAEAVFRKDLDLHPKNPWALIGLIQCLEQNVDADCSCHTDSRDDKLSEIQALKEQYRVQRQMEWADYEIVVACECCTHSK